MPSRTALPYALLACATLALCLWAARIHPGEQFGAYASAWVLLWAAAPLLMLLLPRGLGQGREAAYVAVLALGCRLAFLTAPVASDVYRYLWEGRVLAAGISPYAHAPLDPLLAGLRDALVWPRINNPGLTACYPPLMPLAFAGLGKLWYSPFAVKLTIIGADLAALACLLALLHTKRLPLRSALFYAVNPVLLFAFAAEAHLDALLTFALAAALLAFETRRWGWMYAALALAVQTKYPAALCLPFFVTRANWRYAWIAALGIVVPFLAVPGLTLDSLFQSLTYVAVQTDFNASLYAAVLAASGSRHAARVLCGVFVALVLGWAMLRRHPERDAAADPARGALCALGALLLAAPVVYFWYFTWLAPLFVRRQSWVWLLPCLALGLSQYVHAHWAATGVWAVPPILAALEWSPVLLALAAAAWLGFRRPGRRLPKDQARTVSVVIPTLCEEAEILGCIEAVRRDHAVQEIIVVDGGSDDATQTLARTAGARVLVQAAPIESGGGRGGQIAAGLRAATQDVVAVVHADSRPEPGVFSRACAALRTNPECICGAAGGWFAAPGAAPRLIQIANDARASFFGIAFGDQMQFFRREDALQLGLVQAQPLMEDVECSLRGNKAGPTLYLWAATRTSARAWRSGGLSRAAGIVYRFLAYVMRRSCGGLCAPPDTVAMYRHYYAPRQRPNDVLE